MVQNGESLFGQRINEKRVRKRDKKVRRDGFKTTAEDGEWEGTVVTCDGRCSTDERL